ncbi:hypothetical protein IWQ62_000384 [Dispira parvispora]|uniref:Carbohydrate kinase PfkB domain-containing protein n=1 Tax=Dispira parvispora TaxID=1520584 RepID=A0A9W8B0A4_9FUNG|nr:hypothetical protein IWQ62_000384 [Dispira parvispora]
MLALRHRCAQTGHTWSMASPLRTRFHRYHASVSRLQGCSSPWRNAPFVHIEPEVQQALDQGQPVVALESTIITHGMPFPDNLQTAQTVERIVRDQGSIPATIALLDGCIRVGLSPERLAQLAEIGSQATKTSRRDLAPVLMRGLPGATTVSATMLVAHRVGIPIFVTGGIGGVHRGVATTLDISADLTELGRTPVAVVCSGTKSILDIPKTLEYLETQGVPVVTLGSSARFPAFFTADSGYNSPWWTSDPAECASFIHAQNQLGLATGMVVAVPVPDSEAANGKLIQKAIDQAIHEASELGITGKDVTPFLLHKVNELTQGKSLQANIALIKNNAAVGSTMARQLAELSNLSKNNSGHSTIPFQQATNAAEQSLQPIIIGGCAVDVVSTCTKNQTVADAEGRGKILGTSNPGTIHYSVGGVGYNIARVCQQLGYSPRFVSWVGADAHAQSIRNDLKQRGMDTHFLQTIPEKHTAVYNAIHDADGELVVAVADMDVLAGVDNRYVLDPSLFPTGDRNEAWSSSDVVESIRNTNLTPTVVCMDGNLSLVTLQNILMHSLRNPTLYTIFEPTSRSKARKLVQAWKKVSTVLPTLPTGLTESTIYCDLCAVQMITPDKYELTSLGEELCTLYQDQSEWTLAVKALARALGTSVLHKGVKLEPSFLLDLARVWTFVPTVVLKLGPRGVVVVQRDPVRLPVTTEWTTHWQDVTSSSHQLNGDFPRGSQVQSMRSTAEFGPNRTLLLNVAYLAGHPCPRVVSVAGAGDSMVGTVIAGLIKSYSQTSTETETMDFLTLLRIVNNGQRAAVLSLQSKQPISPEINPLLLE